MGPNHYQVVVGLQIHQKEPPAWWGEDRAAELMWRESSISNGIRMGQWLVEDTFLLGSGKVLFKKKKIVSAKELKGWGADYKG